MIEGGTRFALGVSMALRRGAFAKAGGYEDLGQYYAEDFVLGQRLAEAGFGVRMANYVVRPTAMPQGLRASFRDQLRWMKSTRRSRPAGHLGTGLTYAVPFGLLGLAWGILAGHPALGVLWLLGTRGVPLGDGGGSACSDRGRAGGLADDDLSAARPAGICGVGGRSGYMVGTTHDHGGAYVLGVGRAVRARRSGSSCQLQVVSCLNCYVSTTCN